MWYDDLTKPATLRANRPLEQRAIIKECMKKTSWKRSKGFVDEYTAIETRDEALLRYISDKLSSGLKADKAKTLAADSTVSIDLTTVYERNRRRRKRAELPTYIERAEHDTYLVPAFAPAAHIETAYKRLAARQGPAAHIKSKHPISLMCSKTIPCHANEEILHFEVEDFWAYEFLTGINAALVITSEIFSSGYNQAVIELALSLIPQAIERIYLNIHRIPAIYWKLSLLKNLTGDFVEFVAGNECIYEAVMQEIYKTGRFSADEKKEIKNTFLPPQIESVLVDEMSSNVERILSHGIRQVTRIYNESDAYAALECLDAWLPQTPTEVYYGFLDNQRTQSGIITLYGTRKQEFFSEIDRHNLYSQIHEKAIVPFAAQYISFSMKEYVEKEITKMLYPPKGRRSKPDYRNKYEHAFSLVYPAVQNVISQIDFGKPSL